VRLSTQMPPGAKSPAGSMPHQLDNPPLTRSIVPSATPPQYVVADPFAGFGVLEILNIRLAMNDRLVQLAEESQANPDNIDAVKRVLQVISGKLDPRPMNQGLAVLPIPHPPMALGGTIPLPQPLPPSQQIVGGDLSPGAQSAGDK
jgi:hypothetical protein